MSARDIKSSSKCLNRPPPHLVSALVAAGSSMLYKYTVQEGRSLEFRRRHNTYFATLHAYGSGDPIGVVTRDGIEIERWLGIVDRDVARKIPTAVSVILDIQSWRWTLLDPYQRLGPGVYMVGARMGESGVVGIMEKTKPMLRLLNPEEDKLGRNKR